MIEVIACRNSGNCQRSRPSAASDGERTPRTRSPVSTTWRRSASNAEIGFGIGIAHGYATLGTIGFEGRFDYAAGQCPTSLLGSAMKPSPVKF